MLYICANVTRLNSTRSPGLTMLKVLRCGKGISRGRTRNGKYLAMTKPKPNWAVGCSAAGDYGFTRIQEHDYATIPYPALTMQKRWSMAQKSLRLQDSLINYGQCTGEACVPLSTAVYAASPLCCFFFAALSFLAEGLNTEMILRRPPRYR